MRPNLYRGRASVVMAVLMLSVTTATSICAAPAEVRRVLGDPSARLEGNSPEVALDECAYLASKSLPEGIGLMFAGETVHRVGCLPEVRFPPSHFRPNSFFEPGPDRRFPRLNPSCGRYRASSQ
jgi:hypothetical protein